MNLRYLTILLLCSGCAGLSQDPWDWLSEPAEQSWRDVRIVGFGREITYSIPDRLHRGGKHPRIWPPLDEKQSVQQINMPNGTPAERTSTLAQYIWDRWWGGFYKEIGHDFSLNVRIDTVPSGQKLLDLGLPERIARQIEYRESVYSGKDSETRKMREYFFERFWVKSLETDNGSWVVHNNPAVTSDHVYYTIPISDHHILEFSFFVRDKRYDWKDDPEWNASRWALVEQIMNSVRITPSPHSTASDVESGGQIR